MELFEQGIRQRLSSEQLIGCYFVSGSLRGFKDIRGGEGEPIEVEGMDEIIVSYDDEFLVDRWKEWMKSLSLMTMSF